MQHVRQSIQSVLRRNVDSAATVEEVDASNRVSPFLLGELGVYEARVLGRHIFVAECLHEPVDLDALARQILALENALGDEVVPYLHRLERNVRRSLVEGRQAFICESGDLYLPSFALALSEAAAQPQAIRRAFTASDQAVFLYGLYTERFTAADVMTTTALSSATVSRALQNMVSAQMIDYSVGGRTGRLKEFFKPDNRLYFLEGRRLFGHAVRSTLFTNVPPSSWPVPALRSGLSALSARSNLAEPKHEAWAACESDATRIPQATNIPGRGRTIEVQLLGYDPAPFALDGIVDPFTMLATIPEEIHEDERVRMAIENAMEGYTWYEG
ncbi:MAG: hypothetical protein Q4A07_01375 [Coriobacteriales bacterium]|nr:hypothetical protein [Coriobacteriales bacterium]